MNFFNKFGKLKIKSESLNKRVISLLITIFCILLIVTGASAAYLMSQKGGSSNKITAGTLVLSLPTESEGITLNGALPTSNEIGVSGSNNYTFTLKNSGTLKMNYAIYLKNNCSTTSSVTIDSETITPDICIPNEYIKVGIKKGTEDYKIITLDNDELLMKGTMDSNETIDFSLKIWLDENTPNEYNAILDGVERNIIYYGNLELTGQQYINLDKSGANVPELATGMIPVYYDETNEVWKKADETNIDSNNKWYDYNKKVWANAVTVTETNRATYLNAAVGTPISMDDINTMWVWIPRFSATTNGEYNGITGFACKDVRYTTKEKCESQYSTWYPTDPGAFNITFVDNKTNAHDAFTFGTQSLSGFWVGKFENSSDTTCSGSYNSALGFGCNLTTIRPKIIPNVESWRGAQVSTFYLDVLAMTEINNQYGFDKTKDTTLDTHMMKNNEWGAVAYLTQSIYGKCTSITNCTEIGTNNNEYITGYGAPTGSSKYDKTYKYNENKIETIVVEGTGTNVSTTITNDATYPWVNTNGVWTSSNNGKNSTTATLVFSFTLSSKGVVSFDYSVSSRVNNSIMLYTINNGTTDVVIGDTISGTTRGTTEENLFYDNKVHVLDAGIYTLTFTYVKDSQQSYGFDKGYVKNVKVLAGAETISKEVLGGQIASTTGNIYGVYDMSGGALEYVMGVYTDGTQNWSGDESYGDETYNSGFSGCLGNGCSSTYTGVEYPDPKYYNSYNNTGTFDSPITNYTSDMQHALTETKTWYGDDFGFVDSRCPWFLRGGQGSDENKGNGIFEIYSEYGLADNNFGSRSSLIIN
ncbi:MAG: hypothetical protein PUC23_02665 [bacterium]|nr:hypothetical protein [bacterium]